MHSKLFASLIALAFATALSEQTSVSRPLDFSTAAVAAGSWIYQALPGGSEARFVDSTGTARLALHCTRATRRVSISHVSGVPAASMSVWTSSASRNLPVRFDAGPMRVTAEVLALDPLLDAIAFSRGRFAVTLSGGLPLVVPAWPEPARTIEDCRI